MVVAGSVPLYLRVRDRQSIHCARASPTVGPEVPAHDPVDRYGSVDLYQLDILVPHAFTMSSCFGVLGADRDGQVLEH